MTNLINARPRFGYNPATGLIYDYLAQRDVTPIARYKALDGDWDLLKVRTLIEAGQQIEVAHLTVKSLPTSGQTDPRPVAGVSKEGAKEEVGAQGTGQAAPWAISAMDLQAAKLSGLQCVALGITEAQVAVTGVSSGQVAGWKLNPVRIKALKLSPEQVNILSRAE